MYTVSQDLSHIYITVNIRSLPTHDHIVNLRGVVVDESYGVQPGSSSAVLLVMDRLKRDLYQGMKAGMTFRYEFLSC